MNTPEPCCCCGQLYVDAMQKDNPNYIAECMNPKGEFGNKECKGFTTYHWLWDNLELHEGKK